MDSSKTVYTALFALACVACCSIYVAVEAPGANEMVKAPLPSVDSLTGSSLFKDEDKPAEEVSDDDDESDPFTSTDSSTENQDDPFNLESSSSDVSSDDSSSSDDDLSDGDSVNVESSFDSLTAARRFTGSGVTMRSPSPWAVATSSPASTAR